MIFLITSGILFPAFKSHWRRETYAEFTGSVRSL